jgi:lysylphosphatidylglycerol synthetase-like protein (DUF2156 family)
MALPDRRTLPLPYGQRAYIVSDLDLSPAASDRGAPHPLVEALNDLDDPTHVIVAGNCFADLDESDDPATSIRGALQATPALLAAWRRVVQRGGSVTVLPGSRNRALERDDCQQELDVLGMAVASDVMIMVATAQGVRELLIAAGSHDAIVMATDREPDTAVRHLEDPTALGRFTQSRLLYRRLGGWFWLPPFALVTFAALSLVVWVTNHFGHRHLTPLGHHHWRVVGGPNGALDTVALVLLGVALFEITLAGLAGFSARRRIEASVGVPPTDLDTLGLLDVGGELAIDLARRVAAHGGVGAIVGGASRPSLIFLDRGMAAAPGASRRVLIEHRGRWGLPNVFLEQRRVGYLEVESGANASVRLVAATQPLNRSRLRERLESLIAGDSVYLSPTREVRVLGSWPSGNPWPLDRTSQERQRRFRRIRRLLATLVGLVGALNISVAVIRPLRAHLHNAFAVVPIGVVQSAAALTALAGLGLVMVARGLHRGQRRPYLIACGLLLVTVISHLARGGSLLSSALSLVLLVSLAAQRAAFAGATDRTPPRMALRFVALAPTMAVVANTLGVKLASGQHPTPSWARTLVGSVERLIGLHLITLTDRADDIGAPVLLAVGLTSIVIALYLFTRPVVDRRLSEQVSSAERRLAELRARDIVRRHGRGTLDYFALRDDKQFFFHRDSLVAYAVYGGVALVSPDPIGPEAERAEVFAAFRAHAERHGWTMGIVGADAAWLDTYRRAGWHSLYLGDEAVVNCATFSLEGGAMKGLRQACTRLAKKGYTVEFHDPATMDPAAMRGILELIAKLRRGDGERGFSMMLGRLFHAKDKGLLLTLVRAPDGTPAAVCQFVPSPAIKGYSLDLMRRDPGEHPNGLLDYALCSTIEELRRRGGRGLSLNFSAFRSVLDGEKGDTTLLRVERWALRRLSGILPIESLWSFNAKYQPQWLPRYLVYPALESFVPVVAAVLRAESLTELPVIGRLLSSDPSNRPGTVVPQEILDQINAPPVAR